MWRAQAGAGHAASCIRRASTRRGRLPIPQSLQALHVDLRRRADPKPGMCSRETLRIPPLQSPCSNLPLTPEQRAVRAWGQTGSRPGFHVKGPEQKHLAPGGCNPTGLRRPAGASGREAGRGSHCSEEERSPADTPRPAARPALARPRRDSSRLNMDRPTAEAPAPGPPDAAVPLSPRPSPAGTQMRACRQAHPPGCSPGHVGEPAPGTDPLPPPGVVPATAHTPGGPGLAPREGGEPRLPGPPAPPQGASARHAGARGGGGH